MTDHIELVEVGPRDGLQNERRLRLAFAKGRLALANVIELRKDLIGKLAPTGLQTIEAGAFVHPKAVPLMQGSDQILTDIYARNGHIAYPVLTPNLRGFNDAARAGAHHVAFFMSASDAYGVPNTGCDIGTSLQRLDEIRGAIGRLKEETGKEVALRGYLSCVFGYKAAGHDVEPDTVVRLTETLLEKGCYEISLGDTLGVGTPGHVRRLLGRLKDAVDVSKLAAHFHGHGDHAIHTTRAAIEEGVRVIDASISGLGGAVTTDDAPGNISTQAAVALCEETGFETGVDMEALQVAADWIEARLDTL